MEQNQTIVNEQRHAALLMGWGLEEISLYYNGITRSNAASYSASSSEEHACMLWISAYIPSLQKLKGLPINRRKLK